MGAFDSNFIAYLCFKKRIKKFFSCNPISAAQVTKEILIVVEVCSKLNKYRFLASLLLVSCHQAGKLSIVHHH